MRYQCTSVEVEHRRTTVRITALLEHRTMVFVELSKPNIPMSPLSFPWERIEISQHRLSFARAVWSKAHSQLGSYGITREEFEGLVLELLDAAKRAAPMPRDPIPEGLSFSKEAIRGVTLELVSGEIPVLSAKYVHAGNEVVVGISAPYVSFTSRKSREELARKLLRENDSLFTQLSVRPLDAVLSELVQAMLDKVSA